MGTCSSMRRRMMMAVGGSTDIPYISNGLIGWWDGLWNTGLETHDNSSTTWKDLAGNNNMTLYGNATFTTNALVIPEKNPSTWANFSQMVTDNNVTLEIVFKALTNTAQTIFNFDKYGSGFKGLATRTNNKILFRQSGPECTHAYTSPLYCGYTYSNDYLYINGEKVTRTGSGGSFINLRYGVSFDARQTYSYSGNIYCIRLYNRTLSAAEIESNYNIDVERFEL